jgi:hypothetical protein
MELKLIAAVDPDIQLSVINVSRPDVRRHVEDQLDGWARLAGVNRRLAISFFRGEYRAPLARPAWSGVKARLTQSVVHLDEGEETTVGLEILRETVEQFFVVRAINRETRKMTFSDPIYIPPVRRAAELGPTR